MKLNELLPKTWQPLLAQECQQAYFENLEQFLMLEWKSQTVFPAPEQVFNALALTPPDLVKVVILGQDPYHDVDQAHGLCFSVPYGIKPPPSVKNIFRELAEDLGLPFPDHGCLTSWASQGVLLLNTVLTVRAHQANSHRKCGWEQFSDSIIRILSGSSNRLVFVLWGNQAIEKEDLVDSGRHVVIKSSHPSPLSAHRGFFGSRPFSAINRALISFGIAPIDWSLPPHQPQFQLPTED